MKITANHVTVARILFLPLPSGLVLWGDATAMVVALVVGTIIGATDALDGWMARRDGPTVMGALLDPTADKLFVACLILPLAAQGFCPPSVAAGIFAREILITGLRTSMEVRNERLKTSQLGKLKTVVQMGGLAVFYFTAFLPDAFVLPTHLLATAILAVILVVTVVRRKKRAPFWLEGALPLWGVISALSAFTDESTTIRWIFWIMLALTWVSGIDYLSESAKVLMKGGIGRADGARILSALGTSALIYAVLVFAPKAIIPMMFVVGGELASGGIDNVVAAESKKIAKTTPLLTGALGLVVGLCIFAMPMARGPVALMSVSALAIVGMLQVLRAYRADRQVFL